MSEQPERQIEKLLKEASAQRRQAAGSPDMHPATREMLRTEIHRRYGSVVPKQAAARGWWFRFLPKLAVLVVLCTSAWLLFFWQDDEQSAALALRDEAIAPPPPSEQPELSPVVARRNLDAAPMPTAAPPPAAEPRPAVQRTASTPSLQTFDHLQTAESEEATAGSVVGPEFFKADRQAMYMGTAVVKKEQATLGQTGLAVDYVALRSSDQESDLASAAFAASTSDRLETPLSKRFTLVNEGADVRLIDADGSVYRGTLQLAGSAPAEAALERTPAAVSVGSTQPAPSLMAAPTDEYVLVNYTLMASGTNRTLGRTVVFQGNLELTEQQIELGRNVFSNTTAPPSVSRDGSVVTPAGLVFPGRLQGRAIVEDGLDLRVDAVPTR